jgi:hypothetical protein
MLHVITCQFQFGCLHSCFFFPAGFLPLFFFFWDGGLYRHNVSLQRLTWNAILLLLLLFQPIAQFIYPIQIQNSIILATLNLECISIDTLWFSVLCIM